MHCDSVHSFFFVLYKLNKRAEFDIISEFENVTMENFYVRRKEYYRKKNK